MTSTAHPQTLDGVTQELPKQETRSERRALTEKMIRFVLSHFAWLDLTSVQDYTYERYETNFPNAKADLDIFDGSGKLAFQGREFRSGMAGYWRPSRVSLVGQVLAEAPALGRS